MEYIIGVEGSPGVGKTTFWNLVCNGYFKEKRERSTTDLIKELKYDTISSLFKKFPKSYITDKKIFLQDTPGHSVFSSYVNKLRSSFSAGILLIDREKVNREDLQIILKYSEMKIPLMVLILNYEREEEKVIEKVIKNFPEYPLEYTGQLNSLNYLTWSNKINLHWSRLIHFLYKSEFYKGKPNEDSLELNKNKEIIYITSERSRREALENEFKIIPNTSKILKKDMVTNNLKLVLSDRKLKKTEMKILENIRITIISDSDFFQLSNKFREYIERKEEIKEEISVFKIVKFFSLKKQKSLLGLSVIMGSLKINSVLYNRKGDKIGRVLSIQKDKLDIQEVNSGEFAIILKGETNEPYVFGSFKSKLKKLKGNYPEEELYWINY